METLHILKIFFFSIGLYNICIEIFKIPKYNNELISIFNIFKRKTIKSKDNNYSHITHTISKYIKLPIYFNIRMQEKFVMANINTTPELYIADIINKSLIFVFLAILSIFVEKTLSLIFIGLIIANITKGYNKVNNIIKIKTEKIEREIPKFLDFMTNSFMFNKNVKEAFESYEKIAGEYLKNNIKITIADMSTGNFINALKRLDARINSYNFSKVVRAIIQVVKGEENTQYLKNLYRESASKEYERLKLEAEKKIEKVQFYSKIIFVCIIIMVFTLLILMLFNNSKKLSGVY